MTFSVTKETELKDGGYIHHLILHHGWLFKRSQATAVTSNLQYRKRYFELSNNALLYAQNEKKTGVSEIQMASWARAGSLASWARTSLSTWARAEPKMASML